MILPSAARPSTATPSTTAPSAVDALAARPSTATPPAATPSTVALSAVALSAANASAAGRRSPGRIAQLLAAVLAVCTLVIAMGCSSDGGKSSAAGGVDKSTTSTSESRAADDTTLTPTTKTLTILVSNDDGYNAPGIDAVVRALSAMPDTEVIVSAPATQQSGKGGNVTEGKLTASDAKTLSGHPAFAVNGTPADSVNWALDGGIDVKPNLVITGINAGQNLGVIADQVSGTVGAARAAAAHGIPALATSLGAASPETINDPGPVAAFDKAATYVVDWVTEHRDGLVDGEFAGDKPLLENLNVPLCAAGELRGLARVEMSESGENAIAAQNCTSTAPQPTDDINAFINGFVTLSPMTLVKAGG